MGVARFTELKGFIAWGVLFKNATWSSLGSSSAASKRDGIHLPSSVSGEGGLAIATNCLVNYALISSLHGLGSGSRGAHVVAGASAKYLCYI